MEAVVEHDALDIEDCTPPLARDMTTPPATAQAPARASGRRGARSSGCHPAQSQGLCLSTAALLALQMVWWQQLTLQGET